MAAAAGVLVLVGVLALIFGILSRAKASRINKTPFVGTGEAARASGNVSVEGNVVCPEPIVAPFSGTPCLFYSIKCTATWKDGETEKSKEIAEQKVAARFAVDDGSGPVAVDASKGGTFEPTRTKSETKGTGIMGGITGKDLMFGQYVVSTGALSLGTKYRVEEEVFPVQPRLYVNGSASAGVIATPSLLRSLMLSNESRDVLLGSALKNSKFALLGGLAGLVVGVGLGIVNSLMAPSANKTASAADPAATTTSEVAALPAAAPARVPAEEAAAPVVPAMTTETPKLGHLPKKDARPASAAGATTPTTTATTATTAATKPTAASTTKAASGAATAPTATPAAPTASAAKTPSPGVPTANATKPSAPAAPAAKPKPKAAPAASK